jgi:hypothetical protein
MMPLTDDLIDMKASMPDMGDLSPDGCHHINDRSFKRSHSERKWLEKNMKFGGTEIVTRQKRPLKTSKSIASTGGGATGFDPRYFMFCVRFFSDAVGKSLSLTESNFSRQHNARIKDATPYT